MPGLPDKVVTYGGPDDPFVRMEERFRLVDGVLYVDRTVIPRGYVANVTVDVRFVRLSWWSRLIRWVRGGMGL